MTVGTIDLQVRFGGPSSAPPVLLLHGYPQTHAMWHRVAQRLAPHHRLVMPDLRGHGDSTKPPDETAPAPAHAAMSKRAMAADLAGLMTALGHERFTLVGHDRGGWVADGLAAYEPEALAEYERCFCRAETIHATCEDYRAGASIDLVHDGASRDAGEKIGCETLVLWGARGVVGRLYEPLAMWQAQCERPVRGEALDAGHFIAEERPEETSARLRDFLAG